MGTVVYKLIKIKLNYNLVQPIIIIQYFSFFILLTFFYFTINRVLLNILVQKIIVGLFIISKFCIKIICKLIFMQHYLYNFLLI